MLMQRLRLYGVAVFIYGDIMGKRKIGKPTVFTPETIDKLDTAFMMGCTDKEACLFANVSESAFYMFLKREPSYKERKELLKHNPIIKARRTVLKSIEDGDDVSARWYLERKKSDEFTVRHDVTVSADTQLTIDERSKALDGFLKRFSDEG